MCKHCYRLAPRWGRRYKDCHSSEGRQACEYITINELVFGKNDHVCGHLPPNFFTIGSAIYVAESNQYGLRVEVLTKALEIAILEDAIAVGGKTPYNQQFPNILHRTAHHICNIVAHDSAVQHPLYQKALSNQWPTLPHTDPPIVVSSWKKLPNRIDVSGESPINMVTCPRCEAPIRESSLSQHYYSAKCARKFLSQHGTYVKHEVDRQLFAPLSRSGHYYVRSKLERIVLTTLGHLYKAQMPALHVEDSVALMRDFEFEVHTPTRNPTLASAINTIAQQLHDIAFELHTQSQSLPADVRPLCRTWSRIIKEHDFDIESAKIPMQVALRVTQAS